MTRNPSGFTLIEMIVSVALFSIVMVIATGAYLSIINLDRRARATNDLVTNLNFSIDSMERDLRTGTNYQCGGTGGDCAGSGGTSITFVNDNGKSVTYSFDSVNHSIKECVDTTCPTGQAITDPGITITNLKFYVRGSGAYPGDQAQPFVVFTTSGSITPDPITGPLTFTIQSSATQRAIDL